MLSEQIQKLQEENKKKNEKLSELMREMKEKTKERQRYEEDIKGVKKKIEEKEVEQSIREGVKALQRKSRVKRLARLRNTVIILDDEVTRVQGVLADSVKRFVDDRLLAEYKGFLSLKLLLNKLKQL